ncbi:unnamed protein product, partial [Hapterophycus canaliculatus]
RVAFLSKENSRLLLALEQLQEEQREQDKQREERETEREKAASDQKQKQKLHSKSWKDRVRRTLDELCAAEGAGELVLTCLKCARLFKDPYVMAPCGHTLCADCCGRVAPACKICGEQEYQVAGKVECVGMAPNRALATLVVKFAFRRKLLETLKDISMVLTNSLTVQQPNTRSST